MRWFLSYADHALRTTILKDRMYFDVDALEHPSLGGWRRYMSLLLFPVADFWLFIVPTVHAHTKMFITGKKDRQTVRHGRARAHTHTHTQHNTHALSGAHVHRVPCTPSHAEYVRVHTPGGSFNYVPSAKQGDRRPAA